MGHDKIQVIAAIFLACYWVLFAYKVVAQGSTNV